jgi:hypothetical protein
MFRNEVADKARVFDILQGKFVGRILVPRIGRCICSDIQLFNITLLFYRCQLSDGRWSLAIYTCQKNSANDELLNLKLSRKLTRTFYTLPTRLQITHINSGFDFIHGTNAVLVLNIAFVKSGITKLIIFPISLLGVDDHLYTVTLPGKSFLYLVSEKFGIYFRYSNNDNSLNKVFEVNCIPRQGFISIGPSVITYYIAGISAVRLFAERSGSVKYENYETILRITWKSLGHGDVLYSAVSAYSVVD